MKVRPIGNRILVRLDPLETMLGSIIIPATALGQDNRKATVLEVGVDAAHELSPGDRVVFNRAHGEHLQGKRLLRELDGDLLLEAEDILIVFEGELGVS